MKLRGRVRAGRRPADGDPSLVRGEVERLLPRRLADVLDENVDAVAVGRLLDRLVHIVGRVVDREVGPERARYGPTGARRQLHERRRADRALQVDVHLGLGQLTDALLRDHVRSSRQ